MRFGEESLRRAASFEPKADVFWVIRVELLAQVVDVVDGLTLVLDGERSRQHSRVRGDDDEDEEKVANRQKARRQSPEVKMVIFNVDENATKLRSP